MANLDTEDKRRSAIMVLPTADSTIDDNDRMNVAGLYSGIDPGVPPVPTAAVAGLGLLLKVY